VAEFCQKGKLTEPNAVSKDSSRHEPGKAGSFESIFQFFSGKITIHLGANDL
jgi:hypothetical protein